MLRFTAALFAFAALLMLLAPTGQAQEDKFTFKDGAVTFDKKGYKEEFDKMQRDLAAKAKKSPRALFKNTYCIDCGGPPGEKLTCRAIVGGKIGKGLCLLGGASACPTGVASVSDGAC